MCQQKVDILCAWKKLISEGVGKKQVTEGVSQKLASDGPEKMWCL